MTPVCLPNAKLPAASGSGGGGNGGGAGFHFVPTLAADAATLASISSARSGKLRIPIFRFLYACNLFPTPPL